MAVAPSLTHDNKAASARVVNAHLPEEAVPFYSARPRDLNAQVHLISTARGYLHR